MYYNLIKTPAFMKTGKGVLKSIDKILEDAHLIYRKKILVTQDNLYQEYEQDLKMVSFDKIVIVRGGSVDEVAKVKEECMETDALIVAFGGGSVLDLVKYSASQLDMPYINVPSALSNDSVYSCVARLTKNGKKFSFGVQPPIGIVVDIDIINKSPEVLLYAGVADIVSNLSAIQDWLLAHNETSEPINELAYMLAKEAALPLLRYKKEDLHSDNLILDLVNGIVTSGLSMIISGNTRGTSGAEHLISHAIDEYFPERSTIHGIQVGWAQGIIAKRWRNDLYKVNNFYELIGLDKVFEKMIPWREEDFDTLIPYALKIRNRYTVFNKTEYNSK
jgi:glycerol-1-phosphate dehydrogenase [NAD(P)+]